jgi:hypothetical protein
MSGEEEFKEKMTYKPNKQLKDIIIMVEQCEV